MSEARNDELVNRANIPASSLLVEYPPAITSELAGRRLEGGELPSAAKLGLLIEPRATTNGNGEDAGEKLNNTDSLRRRPSSSECFGSNETTRNNGRHGILREEPLDIQCGEKTALLFVSKLCQGSKGPCILYNNEWLTPNELQFICGRETAKDWKRSIRHKGKSLKSLIAQGFLKVHPPICDCPGCRVSSPVNRSRLADKCGLSKLPPYLAEKSMVDGFPTMWRRSSTSSDEPSENLVDDISRPRRSHSDEPQYYRPSHLISEAKRPRSSSPDLDRGRINVKRRCLSETSAEQQGKPAANETLVKAGLSVVPHSIVPLVMDSSRHQDPKREMIDHETKREQHPNTANSLASLRRADHPVFTLPSSAYTSNVLYGHNQAHLGLHRHVTSPRILSPSFVRPASSPSAQIRLLHEQAVAPLPSHIYAQQLRQDYPGVSMASMFPYSFTHPLPSNQLLPTHFQKLTPELERHIARTTESLSVGSNSSPKQPDKTDAPPKDIDEHASENSSSPGSDPFSGRKVDGQSSGDKSHHSSVDENFKFNSNEPAEQVTQIYPELAQMAAQWDVEEVCKFVSSVTGSTEYCDVFREQEIDGQALILLTEEHLSNKMGIKLGPALKIKSKIDELRCVYTK